MKDHENVRLPKEQNKSLTTNLKETETFQLPSKNISIIILKKLSEVQYNTDKAMKFEKHYLRLMIKANISSDKSCYYLFLI